MNKLKRIKHTFIGVIVLVGTLFWVTGCGNKVDDVQQNMDNVNNTDAQNEISEYLENETEEDTDMQIITEEEKEKFNKWIKDGENYKYLLSNYDSFSEMEATDTDFVSFVCIGGVRHGKLYSVIFVPEKEEDYKLYDNCELTVLVEGEDYSVLSNRFESLDGVAHAGEESDSEDMIENDSEETTPEALNLEFVGE